MNKVIIKSFLFTLLMVDTASIVEAAATDFSSSEIQAPHFPEEDVRGQELLRSLFVATVSFKLETNLLSPNKRRLGEQKLQLQTEYRFYRQIPEDQEVEIFDRIHGWAQEAVQRRQDQQKKDLIAMHRVGLDLDSLSQEEVEVLYLKCHEEAHLMGNINTQFAGLIEFSRHDGRVFLERISNEEFQLRTENCLLGYSVFDLFSLAASRPVLAKAKRIQ